MFSREPISIAQVVRPAAGGIRRHVSLLLAHLERSRFLPTLFAPGDFRPDCDAPDLRHETLEIAPKTSIVSDLRAIRSLTERLSGQYTLMHAHGLRAALIGVFAAHRADIPALFTAHNLPPSVNALQRALLRQVFRRTTRAIAVSQAIAADLTALGMNPERIEIVPNGIPLAPFVPAPESGAIRASLGIPTTAWLIVAIGRLSPEKGFDVLLKALFSLLPLQPDLALCLVGTGPEEQRLRAQASGSPAIHFTGFLPDVTGILQAADVVVIPSHQEGQGIVALEAMAAGKPIIASRVGGLQETILEGKTGLLIPPGDATALAAALQSLRASPAHSGMIGREGRLRVEQEYTLERMIDRIQSVYNSALSQ